MDTSAYAPLPAVNAGLREAARLAMLGPRAGGNPRVGCVIVDASGTIIASGYHHGAGTPHAEVTALAAWGKKPLPADATVIVTLEPCNHTGRTGPCSHALVRAGATRVIYAVADPHHIASGGGEYLREHGVDARLASDIGLDPDAIAAAENVTLSWRIAYERQRPWVIAKTAMSADGFVAAEDGTSQWITGEDARNHGHHLRCDMDAIMIGTGTLLADDPLLTARPAGEDMPVHQPRPVIVGTRPIPSASRLARRDPLVYPTHDIAQVLHDLWDRGMVHVMIEGGPTVIGQAIEAGLVDQWYCYRAPLVLGHGRPALDGLHIDTLTHAPHFVLEETHTVGSDLLCVYAPQQKGHADVYWNR